MLQTKKGLGGGRKSCVRVTPCVTQQVREGQGFARAYRVSSEPGRPHPGHSGPGVSFWEQLGVLKAGSAWEPWGQDHS